MNNDIWYYSLLCALLIFQITAVPGIILKKNDLADVAWGPAFPLSALGGWYLAEPTKSLNAHAKLMILIVSIWAILSSFESIWRRHA